MMMRYLAFFVIFLPAFIFGDFVSDYKGKDLSVVDTDEVRVLSFVRCFSHVAYSLVLGGEAGLLSKVAWLCYWQGTVLRPLCSISMPGPLLIL